ncbi:unnamed protein product [Cunninghamella echinulata]
MEKELLLEIAKTFPNIHSIDGFYGFDDIPEDDYLPELKKLTHYEDWYMSCNISWMTTLYNNKDKVEYLDISENIKLELIDDKKQYSVPPPPIHLKSFGPTIPVPPYVDDGEYKMIKTILILPTLKNLTYLYISFPYTKAKEIEINHPQVYDMEEDDDIFLYFDEHTFENISQSCPKLETLSLLKIYITISEDADCTLKCDNDDTTATFQRAHHLKSLEIEGKIIYPQCFTYLSKKYSRLKSLRLNLITMPLPIELSESYQSAIHDAMMQFQFLKTLDIYLFYPRSQMKVELERGMVNKIFWPNNEFLQCLLQHPTRLTYLKYNHISLEKYNKQFTMMADSSDQITTNNYSDMINKIVKQQHSFSHLTYLSLRPALSYDILYHYLLQNENSTVLSSSITTLVINEDDDVLSEPIYITDWLDTLPSLTSLEIFYCRIINDKDDLYDNGYYDRGIGNSISNEIYSREWNKYNINVNESHEWLKHRKQQQQLGLSNDDNNNNNNNNNSIYKLKSLTLRRTEIAMKIGFNDFLKKIPYLKKLILDNTELLFPEADALTLPSSSSNVSPVKRICFDLSKNHLEHLTINRFNLNTWNNNIHYDCHIVNKLIIHETTSDEKRIIKYDIGIHSFRPITTSHDCQSFPEIITEEFDENNTILLECKCIDKVDFKH